MTFSVSTKDLFARGTSARRLDGVRQIVIDLHCHLLPGIDDGSRSVEMSVRMAQALLDDGVQAVACTPHILPGLYNNTGPAIRAATAELQAALTAAGVPLQLVTGADNHLVPGMVDGLRSGQLLSLADTRYVLVEPPHHIVPPRIEVAFFELQSAGYVPILTHPERLTWVSSHYDIVERLAKSGVLMQITAASVLGTFGRAALTLAERMLDEGLVHILATDSHDMDRRQPCLGRARDRAAERVGEQEATHLVHTRPRGILANVAAAELPLVERASRKSGTNDGGRPSGTGRGIAGRVLRIFG